MKITSSVTYKNKLIKKIGKKIMVHAYKFNGWLYRAWEYPTIISITDDYVLLGNLNCDIYSPEFGTNRCFKSKVVKDTFWFFMKDEWFNFIVTSTPNGLQIYINLASPFIFEESAIKYIDFDLDFKIFPNGSWCEVDINEFMTNQIYFNYPPALIKLIRDSEIKVMNLINTDYFKKLVNVDTIENYKILLQKYSKE